MIDRREILDTAGTFGLLPHVVEKDYVLGWVLAGIYRQRALAESWIFKGGTCLKKCYFETYRFSEDLDFTLTDPSQIDRDFLAGIFQGVGEWIYEQAGIELPEELQEFEVFGNPRGTVSCQGKLSYRGPIAPRSGGLPRVKLDLTPDELLVLPPTERVIFHDYSDAPEEGIAVLCYAYEEAFAEKVRALGDRARPRDLYDVINLYRNAEARPRPAVLLDVLQQKCKHRSLAVPTLGGLETHRGDLEGSWQPMLGHQLQVLPPVESFWEALPECQRRLKIRPKGGAKDCHLGWWSDLGVRLGVGDAVRGFFGGSGQRSHAELKRSAPAGRPQGGMVYRIGVSLATRALGARCRPGPSDGVPQFSYRHCFCGRGFG